MSERAGIIAQGEAVKTREDFVRFLDSLRQDFSRHGGEWENPTLGTFLRAMHAWSNDCPGYYRNMELPVNPDEPQWRVFAEVLLAARVYG